jgi:hypothetical protein
VGRGLAYGLVFSTALAGLLVELIRVGLWR